MPRASWRGYLRLSLVSCPIYLSPATARTKPIRLHQVWRAAPAEGGGDLEDQLAGQDVPERPAQSLTPEEVEDQAEPARPATRITLRPHDPSTGEEVEKEEVVRGYEYERTGERAAPQSAVAPYPSEELTCWPVSARVGNVQNNDPNLIEPIAVNEPA
jgi:hypothetical protein